jgi:hypothetical protein
MIENLNNNLKCININTFFEALFIGFITFIIGSFLFYISTNENEKKTYKSNFKFFLMGFLLHFIIEIGGLNTWYCNKKCTVALINLSKLF